MNQSATITADQRHGNLFITVEGDLSPEAAHALHAEIETRDKGRGNIFINTEKMGQVTEAGRDLLHGLLARPNGGRIYFIGSQGFILSPDGGRVIVRKPKKAHCNGCRKCSCGNRPRKSAQLLPLGHPVSVAA
jgi:hypothetical protein